MIHYPGNGLTEIGQAEQAERKRRRRNTQMKISSCRNFFISKMNSTFFPSIFFSSSTLCIFGAHIKCRFTSFLAYCPQRIDLLTLGERAEHAVIKVQLYTKCKCVVILPRVEKKVHEHTRAHRHAKARRPNHTSSNEERARERERNGNFSKRSFLDRLGISHLSSVLQHLHHRNNPSVFRAALWSLCI